MLTIAKPEITHANGLARLSATITSPEGSRPMWFEVPEEHGHLLCSERSDAFAVALLPAALATGQDVHAEGILSERLAYHLSHAAVDVLAVLWGCDPSIRVTADELSSEALAGATGVGTGFSGGVDSLCTVKEHFLDPVPESFRLTHLLFFNVGSHGRGAEGERLFRERFARLQPVQEDLGLPFVPVDANVDDFMPWDYQTRNLPCLMCAALALQRGLRRYYMASGSSRHCATCSVQRSDDSSTADLITLPLLGTDTLSACSVGARYNRIEKLAIIAEMPLAARYLDVCYTPKPGAERNCGGCSKCLRTFVTLEALGRLDRFRDRFDGDAYARGRTRYMGQTLSAARDPFLRKTALIEIGRLLRHSAIDIPWQARLRASMIGLAKPLRRIRAVIDPRTRAIAKQAQ